MASEGMDFVVKTPKGLAKTGTQIVPTKVAVEIGEAATVQTQTIVLNDEGVERLEALATIELVGGTVKLRYRSIGLLVADLREQYMTGSLRLIVHNVAVP
jgi:hypothetical protein